MQRHKGKRDMPYVNEQVHECMHVSTKYQDAGVQAERAAERKGVCLSGSIGNHEIVPRCRVEIPPSLPNDDPTESSSPSALWAFVDCIASTDRKETSDVKKVGFQHGLS